MAYRLALSVQRRVAGRNALGVPRKVEIARWIRAALEQDAEVSVRLVGEAEARSLNRDYRGKDYATNILSFAYREGEQLALPEGMPMSGDLVLCVPVVRAEARAQDKALAAHYAHLVVHGMLHLQGYDHHTSADAKVMERREKQLLSRFGIADPYQ